MVYTSFVKDILYVIYSVEVQHKVTINMFIVRSKVIGWE